MAPPSPRQTRLGNTHSSSSQSSTNPFSFRSGAWTPEEQDYANALIEEFKAGSLQDLPEGTSMRGFLAKKLGCYPKRVSKKYESTNYNGKQQYVRNKALTEEDILPRLVKLERLQRAFFQSVQQTSWNKQTNGTILAGTSSGSAGVATSNATSQLLGNCPHTSLVGMRFGMGLDGGSQGNSDTNRLATSSFFSHPGSAASLLLGNNSRSTEWGDSLAGSNVGTAAEALQQHQHLYAGDASGRVGLNAGNLLDRNVHEHQVAMASIGFGGRSTSDRIPPGPPSHLIRVMSDGFATLPSHNSNSNPLQQGAMLRMQQFLPNDEAKLLRLQQLAREEQHLQQVLRNRALSNTAVVAMTGANRRGSLASEHNDLGSSVAVSAGLDLDLQTQRQRLSHLMNTAGRSWPLSDSVAGSSMSFKNDYDSRMLQQFNSSLRQRGDALKEQREAPASSNAAKSHTGEASSNIDRYRQLQILQQRRQTADSVTTRGNLQIGEEKSHEDTRNTVTDELINSRRRSLDADLEAMVSASKRHKQL